jgi:hypothetical protein
MMDGWTDGQMNRWKNENGNEYLISIFIVFICIEMRRQKIPPKIAVGTCIPW